MIIATAGHVDHGKTLLVKALTGVDTDQLPEEKKRNLTIDLGFAYLPIGDDLTIGFIDVPGHERFIRNALCGLAGTDFVLFVIAADDGPMPQTREHLAVIDLMGISRGAIAITKADRVSSERLATVQQEIAELFAPTTMCGAPSFVVSALTGDGIQALAEYLTEAAKTTPVRAAAGNFRLAIDRAFDVVGAGFVVTGTVFSGSVSAGDHVVLRGGDMRLRVRGIHAQNAKAAEGRAGQRCALNLAGLELRKSAVMRGDWLTAEAAPKPVAKFDARMRVLPNLARGLAHWTPVHVHIGAADATGRVAVLDGSKIEPGDSALVQISLDRPVGAVNGDRFIARDQSARFTIGGGQVVDIFPPRRGRASPDRVEWLRAMSIANHKDALAALLEISDRGVDLLAFGASRNLTDTELEQAEGAVDMQLISGGELRCGFSRRRWEQIRATVLHALKSWHIANPDLIGRGEREILSGTDIRLDRETAAAIAAELVRQGVIEKTEAGVRVPDHRARLEPADAAMWQRVEQVLQRAALRPMTVREIATEVELTTRQVESFLGRAGRLGLVVRISANRILTPAALLELARMAEQAAREAADARISVSEFRDRTGVGRNMAIEILEYFDRRHFTRRIGDGRAVLQPADKIFAAR